MRKLVVRFTEDPDWLPSVSRDILYAPVHQVFWTFQHGKAKPTSGWIEREYPWERCFGLHTIPCFAILRSLVGDPTIPLSVEIRRWTRGLVDCDAKRRRSARARRATSF